MSVLLAPQPVFQAFAPNGQFLVAGQLFTYAAGTTTPQASYVDSTQTTQNTNPVILNAMGQANVWLASGQAYKLVLEDSAGNLLWSVDNVQGGINTPQLTVGLPPVGTALTVNGLPTATTATAISATGGSGTGFAVVNISQTSGTGAALNINLNAGAAVAYNVNNGAFSTSLQLSGAGIASFASFGAGSSLVLGVNAAPNALTIGAAGNVIIAPTPSGGVGLIIAPGSTNGELMGANPSLTNGAGASTGTLTNAPSAGNPTKWIKINDNGVIRAFPAW